MKYLYFLIIEKWNKCVLSCVKPNICFTHVFFDRYQPKSKKICRKQAQFLPSLFPAFYKKKTTFSKVNFYADLHFFVKRLKLIVHRCYQYNTDVDMNNLNDNPIPHSIAYSFNIPTHFLETHRLNCVTSSLHLHYLYSKASRTTDVLAREK